MSGKLKLVLPWPVRASIRTIRSIPTAALFAHAVFDQLYALDAAGEPFPTLAADLPATEGGKRWCGCAKGCSPPRGGSSTHVMSSFRCNALVAASPPLGGEICPPQHRTERSARGGVLDRRRLRIAKTLSSPLFALVPRAFDPSSPDGTGAMTPQISGRACCSNAMRTPRAARRFSRRSRSTKRPIFPRRCDRSRATSPTSVGSELGCTRLAPVPLRFDLGSVAWIVLQTGNEAGSWGAPGLAQRLLDGLAPEQLQHFGLGQLPAPSGNAEWGGKPCELLVQEGSAYLDELARTVSSPAFASGSRGERQARAGARAHRRRASGTYSLALGVVRPFAGPGIATLVALAAAVDPSSALELMRSPPRLSTFSPRALTRTLRLGVLGELRVVGAHAPDVRLAKSTAGEGWDLGATYRAPA